MKDKTIGIIFVCIMMFLFLFFIFSETWDVYKPYHKKCRGLGYKRVTDFKVKNDIAKLECDGEIIGSFDRKSRCISFDK